jgi:hypothetical protein
MAGPVSQAELGRDAIFVAPTIPMLIQDVSQVCDGPAGISSSYVALLAVQEYEWGLEICSVLLNISTTSATATAPAAGAPGCHVPPPVSDTDSWRRLHPLHSA